MCIIAELQFRTFQNFTKTPVIFIAFVIFLLAQLACQNSKSAEVEPTPTPETPKIIADSFAYPIGKTEYATQVKDKKDNW